jgi:hypothetical protein
MGRPAEAEPLMRRARRFSRQASGRIIRAR